MIAPWFLFLKFVRISLAAWGLSCSMWDLLLQCMDSLVVAHWLSGFSVDLTCSVACRILVP